MQQPDEVDELLRLRERRHAAVAIDDPLAGVVRGERELSRRPRTGRAGPLRVARADAHADRRLLQLSATERFASPGDAVALAGVGSTCISPIAPLSDTAAGRRRTPPRSRPSRAADRARTRARVPRHERLEARDARVASTRQTGWSRTASTGDGAGGGTGTGSRPERPLKSRRRVDRLGREVRAAGLVDVGSQVGARGRGRRRARRASVRASRGSARAAVGGRSGRSSRRWYQSGSRELRSISGSSGPPRRRRVQPAGLHPAPAFRLPLDVVQAPSIMHGNCGIHTVPRCSSSRAPARRPFAHLAADVRPRRRAHRGSSRSSTGSARTSRRPACRRRARRSPRGSAFDRELGRGPLQARAKKGAIELKPGASRGLRLRDLPGDDAWCRGRCRSWARRRRQPDPRGRPSRALKSTRAVLAACGTSPPRAREHTGRRHPRRRPACGPTRPPRRGQGRSSSCAWLTRVTVKRLKRRGRNVLMPENAGVRADRGRPGGDAVRDRGIAVGQVALTGRFGPSSSRPERRCRSPAARPLPARLEDCRMSARRTWLPTSGRLGIGAPDDIRTDPYMPLPFHPARDALAARTRACRHVHRIVR